MLVGHIREVVRHPVKSMRGEPVSETKIMDYGLYGDRSHAYLDETREGNFLAITQFQEMVRHQARFVGEESLDAYPKVEVTTPEGRVLKWDDDELISELEEKSNRKISTTTYEPTHVPIGPIAEEHILVATDASLNELEGLWDKGQVDARRFRPNIIVSLTDKVPFIEDEWLGRRMKIGKEVEVEFVRHCTRCMIITVDPDSAERDKSLHKTVIQERNNCFGVYASVIKTGNIHVNDEIHLID